MIKLSNLSTEETKQIIPDNTILLGYMGSISHGTFIPNSNPTGIDDIDIMGVCILPKSEYLGMQINPKLKGRRRNNEQQEIKYKEWDSIVYEIIKFFKLLLKQNPNVLGLLWLQEKDYIYIDEYGQEIINNRNLFISKKAYHSFVGYAKDQLYKMTHGAYQGYMGIKRKALVDKFGFDVKNGAHLVRLLRMGIEYLVDGELQVFRKDAKDIKAIKQGKWSLTEVKDEAKRLFNLSQEAYIKSSLPPKPNYKKANELLINIIERNIKL